MENSTILECVVGSTLHGTHVSDGLEDLDLMAVVLEEKELFCGFNVKDTWTHRTKPQGVRSEAGDVDWVGYGLRKYLTLALKGNPTVLLVLFAPQEHTREITGAGKDLRALAPQIVSKACFAPFRGYMKQQHERLMGTRGQKNVTRPELVEKYGYDTKYAAHVVRLGLQGCELLNTGRLTLPMAEAERRLCVAIRTGEYTLEQVSDYISVVERNLVHAYEHSPLPDAPDVEAVEAWMLKVYSVYWNTGML